MRTFAHLLLTHGHGIDDGGQVRHIDRPGLTKLFTAIFSDEDDGEASGRDLETAAHVTLLFGIAEGNVFVAE